MTTPTPNTSRKLTVILDQASSTKLQWCSMFLTEAGMPNPKQREIIARSIDYYTEYLEELCTTHAFSPKHKDIKEELYDVSMLRTERKSAWNSVDLPRIDLSSFGAFPKYSTLARQYIQPVKTQLPRVRKRKGTEASFAFHAKKYQLPEVTHEVEPIELTSSPDVGKLLFNKFENQ